MKTYLLIMACLLMSSRAMAQREYRLFRVDIAGGYANEQYENGGPCLSIEPKINLTDLFAIGVKAEVAETDEYVNYESLVAVSELCLFRGTSRAFVGLAGGYYQTDVFYYGNGLTDRRITGATVLGIAPRAGFQFNHFRIVGEYNLLPDRRYFTIKAGLTIGGGEK